LKYANRISDIKEIDAEIKNDLVDSIISRSMLVKKINNGIFSANLKLPVSFKTGIGNSPFKYIGEMIESKPHGFGIALE
jgi:hypothetical protein